MKLKKAKGFTLIELIAVLVIMAIIALIVTPLVMNIIRKARISADKRSVDAYGRSIELAIAGYLLDTGKFPTEVSQLTIEYSGNQVVCSTTQINKDSSVYLAGCTVAGRNVDGYTYGSDKSSSYQAYSKGDTYTLNNVDYYVIKDSGAKDPTLTLLKAEPLSTAEVNQYGAGHVNMYNCSESDTSCYHTAYDNNGYGGMAYYTSVDCGYGTGSNNTSTGCTTDYAQSEVKYVVDAWAADKVGSKLQEARLLTYDELITDLGYDENKTSSGNGLQVTEDVPTWVYNNNYWYWTGSQFNDAASSVWSVNAGGSLGSSRVNNGRGMVRPVITISKSEI